MQIVLRGEFCRGGEVGGDPVMRTRHPEAGEAQAGS